MSTATQLLKNGVRQRLLIPIGKRLGAPRLHLSSPLIRGGNYLYYWLWAHLNDKPGRPARVQYHPAVDDWVSEFPLARKLTMRLEDASFLFTDFVDGHFHDYGVDFDRTEMDQFCRELVDTSDSFRARLDRATSYVDDTTCVVNVRRGDYYQYPHLTATYGLDIEGFVARALTVLKESGAPIDRFVLVSDDIDWCRKHLAELLGPSTDVIPDRSSMFDDLAAIAAARTVLLANSTFSFWGAYLGSALGNQRQALVPDRQYIKEDGSKATEPYDPRWQVIPDEESP